VKKIMLLSLLVGLLLVTNVLAGEPQFNTNTVYMDTVTAKPGEQFKVNVYLYNVDSLAGCQVPIFFRTDKDTIWCDSISFVDSRMGYFKFNDVKLPMTEKDDKVAYFSFINTIDPKVYVDPLPPGNGLLATLYFTTSKNFPEGVIQLRRGMIPHPHISFIFAVWTQDGEEVDGNFIESEIRIKK
jgi:hypothetical protein